MASHFTLKRILVAATIVVVAGIVWFRRPDLEAGQRDIERLFRQKNYEQVLKSSDELLQWNSDLNEVRLLAAQSAAQTESPNRALEYLNPLADAKGTTRLKAALLEADLALNQLFDLERAETAYRNALSIDADNVSALDGLVHVLAVCGRRRDAIPHLLNLVRLGAGSEALTISARGSGAVSDPDLLAKAVAAFPDNSAVLIGLAIHAERSERLPEAIELCRKAVASDPTFAPAAVYLGQYLLDEGNFTELQVWSDQLSETCLSYAETWRVRGYLAEHQGRRQEALVDYLRAAELGPELKDVQFQLSQLLRRAGDPVAADKFAVRLKQIQKLEAQQDRMFAAGTSSAFELIELIRQFKQIGRLWEAFGWTQAGLRLHPNDGSLISLFNELRDTTRRLPLQLEADAFSVAKTVSAGDYLLPAATTRNHSQQVRSAVKSSNISFRNDASSIGLEFEYVNGIKGPTTHRMFEFTGGGIGVCDFDLDDYPDLFCSQGGLWGTRSADAADLLFRNVRGAKFANASAAAGISDVDFGQGVAVGDVNGDGFPDVFVANIGPNVLWVNNGDGTFFSQSFGGDAAGEWSTSALIADLNRDGAADIFVTNYVTGDDVYDRVCGSESSPQACIPIHFDGVRDGFYRSDVSGQFVDESRRMDAVDRGKGLGVVAFSPSNDGRLSVFVANDTTTNMLLTIEDDGSVVDHGFSSGLAVNGRGKSEGCMGIAVGDVNDDGLSELLITNFFRETNTYYQAVGDNLFEDRTDSVALADATLKLLGFGTQFLDADRDGRLELVVANGHVDDLRQRGKPYKMPAQFFQQRDSVFQLLDADSLGEYFQANHLGRSVVCLDWNRDGLPDVVVGHLAEPYALLTNTSQDMGNGVVVRLVGTTSERDAIGTTVSYQLGDRTMTRQLTAGDGYMASNQRVLWLACGQMSQIDSLSVVWPSGYQQTVDNVPAGGRCVLREDGHSCFVLPE